MILTTKFGTRNDCKISHGSVVIAAITSCTNTSNPSVMLGAGLLARKAVEAGAHGTLEYTIKEGANKDKIADQKILKKTD